MTYLSLFFDYVNRRFSDASTSWIRGWPHQKHELWRHSSSTVIVGRSKEEMHQWLESNNHKGLVFHHPDGKMDKTRRKDFGLKW